MQLPPFLQLLKGVEALAETVGVGGRRGQAEGVEGSPEIFAEAGIFVVGAKVGELFEGGVVLCTALVVGQ